MNIQELPVIKDGLAAIASRTQREAADLASRVTSVLDYGSRQTAGSLRIAEAYYHYGIDDQRERGTDPDLRRGAITRGIAGKLGWRYARICTDRYGSWRRVLSIVVPRAVFETGQLAEFTLVAKDDFLGSLTTEAGVYRDITNTQAVFVFIGHEFEAMVDKWKAGRYHNPDWIKAITKRGNPVHDYDVGFRWA